MNNFFNCFYNYFNNNYFYNDGKKYYTTKRFILIKEICSYLPHVKSYKFYTINIPVEREQFRNIKWIKMILGEEDDIIDMYEHPTIIFGYKEIKENNEFDSDDDENEKKISEEISFVF